MPLRPPDEVPAWVYADTNTVTDPPAMSGRIIKNVVVLWFADSATQAQRQAAVRLVCGEVVGGMRAFGDDGYYFVRVPSDSLARGVFEAIRRLAAVRLPYLIEASPEIKLNLIRPPPRAPK